MENKGAQGRQTENLNGGNGKAAVPHQPSKHEPASSLESDEAATRLEFLDAAESKAKRQRPIPVAVALPAWLLMSGFMGYLAYGASVSPLGILIYLFVVFAVVIAILLYTSKRSVRPSYRQDPFVDQKPDWATISIIMWPIVIRPLADGKLWAAVLVGLGFFLHGVWLYMRRPR